MKMYNNTYIHVHIYCKPLVELSPICQHCSLNMGRGLEYASFKPFKKGVNIKNRFLGDKREVDKNWGVSDMYTMEGL